eukprot:CAMPEP_0201264040 /NCGR_PEP_ID=MMETSP0853-20130426/7741_1 /ASSEMBLY_ACC=CAM_ASM_000640 /TAXON_ID=183588 /ORGANISM="Pseudo-nitzschia fraudulenta, Strain WWA7" /LENGTH=328 /DNA_ID=CAMNT_0047567825 /DNA_START=102 /DNA_END=1088 /DNA_ORIENTATION=+
MPMPDSLRQILIVKESRFTSPLTTIRMKKQQQPRRETVLIEISSMNGRSSINNLLVYDPFATASRKNITPNYFSLTTSERRVIVNLFQKLIVLDESCPEVTGIGEDPRHDVRKVDFAVAAIIGVTVLLAGGNPFTVAGWTILVVFGVPHHHRKVRSRVRDLKALVDERVGGVVVQNPLDRVNDAAFYFDFATLHQFRVVGLCQPRDRVEGTGVEAIHKDLEEETRRFEDIAGFGGEYRKGPGNRRSEHRVVGGHRSVADVEVVWESQRLTRFRSQVGHPQSQPKAPDAVCVLVGSGSSRGSKNPGRGHGVTGPKTDSGNDKGPDVFVF